MAVGRVHDASSYRRSSIQRREARPTILADNGRPGFFQGWRETETFAHYRSEQRGLFELYHSRLDPAGPRDGACVRAACKLRPAEPIFEKMFRSDPVSYLVRRCVQIQLQVAVPDFRRSQSYPVSRSSTKLSPEHD